MATFSLTYNQDFVFREIKMAEPLHGYCDLDEEGRANIYLNADDPEERKMTAAKHELLHVVNLDHYDEASRAEKRVGRMLNKTRLEYICCVNL